MPSKIAVPSRVVSRKALLPGRFNGSRTLLSPRENAKFLNFHDFSTTPEVPKALRRTSGSLPGTRSETRPGPESYLRINPTVSRSKTTPFRSLSGQVRATNKPQAPAPVELFCRPHPLPFLYQAQVAGRAGSADSEGLRPHAPTLEKALQAILLCAREPNLIRARTQTHITNSTCPSPQPQLHFRPKSGPPCVHGWFPKPRHVFTQEA